MIDIHAHILPGLDDGAKTLNDALSMCRIAVEDGITDIIATPHTMNGTYLNGEEAILEKVKELNSALKQNKINIKVYPGSDVRIYPRVISDIEEDKVLTLNNNKRYVLLEMPFQTIPIMALDILSQLADSGVTPVVSHPERNEQVLRQFEILAEMKRRKALLQVTAMSLTGEFGEEIKDLCIKMLKEGLVDIIASDAHSPDKRPPVLSAAVSAASEIVGTEAALRTVEDTPRQILNFTLQQC